MLELQISAKIRDKFGKQTKSLKKNGVIPAVLYGHGSKATALSLDLKEFAKIYKQAGESTIINLNIEKDGKAESRPVLIHEVDFDPVSDQLRHADFYIVKMDEKITAKIPLVFIGESDAIKVLNGILIKNLHEIEIEALPKDLPHQIEIDISVINTFSDHIYIKDLKLSQGVKVLDDASEIVVLVKPPRTEEEIKALEGEVKIDIEAVKVETEEKKKEREAEAENKVIEEEAKQQ